MLAASRAAPPLEYRARVVDLRQVLDTRQVEPNALERDLENVFADQAADRFAHGRAADVERFGKAHLRDRFGTDLPLADHLPKLVVRLFGEGRCGSRGHGFRYEYRPVYRLISGD